MRTAGSSGRRGAAAPTGRVLVALILLLALTAASRAHAGEAAAVGTFGKTTLGSAWQNMTDDAKRGSRYVYAGPAGSELYQVTAPLRGNPSKDGIETQAVDVAVYADQGGEPGALLGQSDVNTLIAGKQEATLVTFLLTQPVPLQPGAHYWLMIHAGQTGAIAEYSYDAAPGALRYETPEADAKPDGARNPAGPMLADARAMAIWGSYRPAASGPPTPPDRDTDGVPDADDRCPDVSGPGSGAGCPASTTPTAPDPPGESPAPPQVATSPAQDVTPNSAVLTGIVVPQGDTRWYFEWGTTARLGRRTATETLPAAAGAAQVTTPLTGLRPRRRYHVRLVAEGPGGRAEGETQSFRSQPLPRIDALLGMSLGCLPGAATCRIDRSSLDITLRESDGQPTTASRHARLQVRLVLRQGDRVLARSSFKARSRVRPRALRGPGQVTLRRHFVDGTSRYTLGGLMRGGMAVGTTLEVFVTRTATIGGYFRFELRPRGEEIPRSVKRRCAIHEGTTKTLRDCRTL